MKPIADCPLRGQIALQPIQNTRGRNLFSKPDCTPVRISTKKKKKKASHQINMFCFSIGDEISDGNGSNMVREPIVL